MQFFEYYKTYKMDALGAFLALLFVLGLPQFASADTYTRTPNTTGGVGENLIVSFLETDENLVCPQNQFPPFLTPAGYRIVLRDDNSDTLSGSVYIFGDYVQNSTLNSTNNFTINSPFDVSYIGILCYENVNDDPNNHTNQILIEFDYSGNDDLFHFSGFPYNPPTSGGSISFVDFDDINPTDMIASVRQGTIDTTDKVFPLLVFVGIPLAFLLLVMVSKLINNSIKPEKKGNGRGWTAHGAMEHDLTAFKKKERSRIKRGLE